MHTPGPWTYEASTKTVRSEPANYWLASMDSWDGAIDNEANARLIASAPDLLAALEGLLIAYITELSPEQRRACKGEKSTEDIDGNVREARAAIAKAKP